MVKKIVAVYVTVFILLILSLLIVSLSDIGLIREQKIRATSKTLNDWFVHVRDRLYGENDNIPVTYQDQIQQLHSEIPYLKSLYIYFPGKGTIVLWTITKDLLLNSPEEVFEKKIQPKLSINELSDHSFSTPINIGNNIGGVFRAVYEVTSNQDLYPHIWRAFLISLTYGILGLILFVFVYSYHNITSRVTNKISEPIPDNSREDVFPKSEDTNRFPDTHDNNNKTISIIEENIDNNTDIIENEIKEKSKAPDFSDVKSASTLQISLEYHIAHDSDFNLVAYKIIQCDSSKDENDIAFYGFNLDSVSMISDYLSFVTNKNPEDYTNSIIKNKINNDVSTIDSHENDEIKLHSMNTIECSFEQADEFDGFWIGFGNQSIESLVKKAKDYISSQNSWFDTEKIIVHIAISSLNSRKIDLNVLKNESLSALKKIQHEKSTAIGFKADPLKYIQTQ